MTPRTASWIMCLVIVVTEDGCVIDQELTMRSIMTCCIENIKGYH